MRDPESPEPHACGAKTRNGQTCPMPPMSGQSRCRMHGGSTALARAKAQRVLTEQNARKTIAQLITAENPDVDGDPLQSLLRMVQVAAWTERAYAGIIEAELAARVLVETGSKVAGFKEEPHPYLKLWNEERDRLAKYSKLALDAGVADKQVKLGIAQVEMTANILDASLDEAGVDPKTRFAVLQGMARRLRASP